MLVRTPVAGFTGIVAGVVFTDGVSDDPVPAEALAYFVRHGYLIEAPERARPAVARATRGRKAES